MGKENILEQAVEENWKVCAYGLGVYGKAFISTVVKYLNVIPDFYCDKDEEILNKFAGSVRTVSVEELKDVKQDVLVLIFLSEKHMNSFYEEFQECDHLHFLTWGEMHQLLDKDVIINKYFELENVCENRNYQIEDCSKNISEKYKLYNPKIAVYTCITNKYDEYNIPLVFEKQCDYFFISDEPKEFDDIDNVKIINIEDVCPKHIKSPKDKNRYCKMHGYKIFSQYDYSIYLDGGIQIIAPIANLVLRVGDKGVAFHMHPFCTDAYLEAFSLAERSRIKYCDAKETMQKFAKDGFPRHYGLAEAGVVISDTHSSIAKKILTDWFEQYSNNSVKRDQIYLSYTLWKMKIPMNNVCTLPGNIRTNGYFKICSSHKGYQQ